MREASSHGTARWPCLTALVCCGLGAQDPGREFFREAAGRATQLKAARDHYTYRQSVVFQELDPRGTEVGRYSEVREVIFLPAKGREEVVVGRPLLTLKNLKLTEEDFRDIREVKPFVLSLEELPWYRVDYRGREKMDEWDCFVYRVAPRQVFEGQRLFEGLIWVSENDRQIVRAEGRPVPQIHRLKGENLFPHFTTIYRPLDGRYWFPVRTLADDTLHFRSGPQRLRLTVRYDDYKRFGAESAIQYQGAVVP